MIVSVPFSAAAAPPEMPASRNSTPAVCRRRVERDGRGRRGRAQVDDDLAGAAVREQAAVAEHDRLDDAAVGQREQHDVDARARAPRRGSPAAMPASPSRRRVGVEADDRLARASSRRRAIRPPMLPAPMIPIRLAAMV